MWSRGHICPIKAVGSNSLPPPESGPFLQNFPVPPKSPKREKTMSSALLPRCPSRGPHPALSSTVGGSDVHILPMKRRPARCGGVFCCSNSTSTPLAAVEKGPGFSGNFYEVLGIPQDGSFDEIKQAYKRMALKYHPDVCPPDCAAQYTQHFIELKEAYETLSDPATRAVYDRDLAGGLHLTFSRRGWDEKMEKQSRWKANWEDQLEGLQERSMRKQSGNLSWAAQMRRKRDGSSSE